VIVLNNHWLRLPPIFTFFLHSINTNGRLSITRAMFPWKLIVNVNGFNLSNNVNYWFFNWIDFLICLRAEWIHACSWVDENHRSDVHRSIPCQDGPFEVCRIRPCALFFSQVTSCTTGWVEIVVLPNRGTYLVQSWHEVLLIITPTILNSSPYCCRTVGLLKRIDNCQVPSTIYRRKLFSK